ncbi:pyruvate kinase [Youxingia wuxianensis]|uniref:Pyruvate kinase n=1 Tax=Youxingia wuxianensis TaxID=2763678 RepID=A0A926IBW2_9FIRM|nr:pyruvate kinase [Youxingia wuxianensis]MBC8584547.1 pyruvate kinase [Youxingia wuxianensis]
MRKTKIVCTLGPASNNEKVIHSLICAGMDVARFNFSHGTHESHLATYKTIDRIRRDLNLPTATLLDTKGPEIRLGKFKEGKAFLKKGNAFTLSTKEILGDENMASITFPGLVNDVKPGNTLLLADGLIELKVVKVNPWDITCEIMNDGPISDHKGVNVPGVRLSMPYLSEKDRSDIIFGVENDFDFIAASFTRCAQDILEIRQLLDEQGCHTIKIIAKIENLEGVQNIDEILRVSDGIMVARGDMGVEVPLEDVPVFQKVLIKKAYNAGKMVITATQMLESMMHNPRPTRAEAADVANAIYDGTSAIMLSGETAAGQFPVEAVKTMAAIAQRTENDIDYRKRFFSRSGDNLPDVTNAISHATCTTAYDLGAKAIITVTWSGTTARMLSKYRPDIPVLACTHLDQTYRQLSLSWGVTPLKSQVKDDTDELFSHAVEVVKNAGYVQDGDIVVITAGIPLGVTGTTNMLKVHVVGDILVSGQGVNKKSSIGRVCVAHSEEEALENFVDGDILVIPQTSNNLLPILKKASGIVTETGGFNSHAAIVGLALDIPVVVGATNATSILKSSTQVEIDAERGIVSNAKSK